MATLVYTGGNAAMLDGTVDWETSDIRCLMLAGSATVDVDHDFVSNVVAWELSGSGYARVSASNRTIVADDTNNRVALKCDPVTFPSLGAGAGSPWWLVFYLHTGSDATARLIGIVDISQGTGTPTDPDGSDFVIQFNTDGVFWLYNTTPTVGGSSGLTRGQWLALPSAHR